MCNVQEEGETQLPPKIESIRLEIRLADSRKRAWSTVFIPGPNPYPSLVSYPSLDANLKPHFILRVGDPTLAVLLFKVFISSGSS